MTVLLYRDPAADASGRPVRERRRRSRRAGDPMALWRTTEPARISSADVERIAGCIARTEILHERRWGMARTGDAAAAVAIAIDHLARLRDGSPLSDLILGNLVVLARRGDSTAPMILAHALRTLGRIDPANSDLPRLAACWSRRRHLRRPRRRDEPRRGRGDA